MDYSNPDGEKISVGFVTVPASGAATDTVFVNPGGPAGDVYDYAGMKDTPWPAEFNQEFTVVGVQPRGLMGSTPLACFGEGTEKATTLREACNVNQPGYAETVTTENTARDWNEVRKALGLESISLYGGSYGTILASVYATEFPQHTNRVVLDSGLDVESMYADASLTQADGWTKAMNYYFDWVAKNNEEFGLGSTPYAVYRQWAEAVRRETGAYPPITPPAMTEADLPPHSSALGQGAVDTLNAVEGPRAEIESVITQHMVGQAAATSLLHNATMGLLVFPQAWGEVTASINDPAALVELLNGDAPAEEDPSEETIVSDTMYTTIVCNEPTATLDEKPPPGTRERISIVVAIFSPNVGSSYGYKNHRKIDPLGSH